MEYLYAGFPTGWFLSQVRRVREFYAMGVSYQGDILFLYRTIVNEVIKENGEHKVKRRLLEIQTKLMLGFDE